jgi:hypothetical protein
MKNALGLVAEVRAVMAVRRDNQLPSAFDLRVCPDRCRQKASHHPQRHPERQPAMAKRLTYKTVAEELAPASVSKDEATVQASWFETAQMRLLTMRVLTQ